MNKKQTKIKYLDLWGLRKDKYKFLETHNVKNTKWQDLELKEPYFFFVPKNTTGEKKYQKFISVKNIFDKYVGGVKTRRDNFMVGFSREIQKNKIAQFVSDVPDEVIQGGLSIKPSSYWDISQKRRYLKNKIDDSKFIDYLYRPFDSRIIYYDKELIERGDHRFPVMRHLLKNNLAIIMTRRIAGQDNFRHIFISNLVSDLHIVSDQSYVFPLYVYNEVQQGSFEALNDQSPTANFSQIFWDKVKDTLIQSMSPLDLFYYIYGVLYSNIYRKKYNEFLKIDFPKIPFTKNYDLFCAISEIGKELCNLHLLKSSKLNKVVAKFPVSTGNIITDGRVKKREYILKEKRIYINDEQYFEGVEPEIWNYYIGGYQVLDKWLKDRIDRILSPQDIDHYLKIITAIKYTIDLQKQIDEIYPKIERNLIK